MATSNNKSTRGHKKFKKKEKQITPNEDDWELPEDKKLLEGVEDVEEESAVDVEPSGSDIPESELLAFLQKLGVDKYRPFPLAPEKTQDKEKAIKNLKDAKTPQNVALAAARENKSTALATKTVAAAARQKSLTQMTENNTQVKINRNLKNGKVPQNTEENTAKEKKTEALAKKTGAGAAKQKAALQFLKLIKSRNYLLLKPGEAWREEQVHPLPSEAPDEKMISEMETLAKKLLEEEIAVYAKQRENTKNSEARWLKTVLTSGTLTDKMAALTLLVQETPIHNLSSLDTLISMSSKKGRREAMMAVDTLRDLFLTGLLPDDRKLKPFNQQPFLELVELSQSDLDKRDRLLIMWFFEGQLKQKYSAFIKAIGDMSFDTLQATKEKALSTIHQMLTGKPEQETVLLPMLVNKLGDPAIKSKAMYLMTKLVEEHPNMKSVIVREVQQLLYRPNVAQRAQYYAICFLTQLRLNQSEDALASQLIQIYFYFFQSYLKKGEIDNKMMSALLTGVNRAYVYAKANKEEIATQIDSVYKIIPSVNFHTGVQALMLLHQVTDASTSASDRFYMCLYRKLVDPALNNSSKQAIFMNLLFKSLRSDVVDRRIKAFVKRILQVYSPQPPHIVCGVLILLSQILKDKSGLVRRSFKGEGAWLDDEEERFVDIPDPDDLANDPEEDREKPGGDEKELDEGDKVNAGKKGAVSVGVPSNTGKSGHAGQMGGKTQGSWVHRNNFGGPGRWSEYDPYGRNPLYARAELECLWELQHLVQHYHPTVKLYATSLLKGLPIEYDGDPVKDFTLSRFLDRFVYKNPKKNLEESNANMGRFRRSGPSGIRAVPVNSKEYLEAGEDDVPVDEKFFYRYFSERASKVPDNVSDGGSVSDEEFDAFLDDFEKSADDGIDDLDLDFASDKKSKKHAKHKEESEESDDYDDEDEDLDLADDDLAAEFEQEMDEDDTGNAMDGSELSPDEDDELQMMMLGGGGKKRKKPSGDDDDDLDMSFNDQKFKKKSKK
ncbi:unnamed protein product [Lymnaea stagnalis]|uniref:CCAAT-binding factor domain-containing protein n=1 Tax=Lymnaea stagnalis TaxID=6523 RepID=A0AAV2HTC9_LYMST